MSEICSEKDCRSPLEGERDELGISTDISGEGRAREKRERLYPSPLPSEGSYMPAERHLRVK